MRIACLQVIHPLLPLLTTDNQKFDPKLGELAANIQHADAILARETPTDLDLLVLPEMAFTGTHTPPSIPHGPNPHAQATTSSPSPRSYRTLNPRQPGPPPTGPSPPPAVSAAM